MTKKKKMLIGAVVLCCGAVVLLVLNKVPVKKNTFQSSDMIIEHNPSNVQFE